MVGEANSGAKYDPTRRGLHSRPDSTDEYPAYPHPDALMETLLGLGASRAGVEQTKSVAVQNVALLWEGKGQDYDPSVRQCEHSDMSKRTEGQIGGGYVCFVAGRQGSELWVRNAGGKLVLRKLTPYGVAIAPGSSRHAGATFKSRNGVIYFVLARDQGKLAAALGDRAPREFFAKVVLQYEQGEVRMPEHQSPGHRRPRRYRGHTGWGKY